MGHVTDGPQAYRECVAQARAETIDEAAEGDVANAVGRLKPEHHIAVAGLTPAVARGQRRLEHTEHLAVDIAQHHCREQQRADQPAHTARRHRRRRGNERRLDHQLNIEPSSSRLTGRYARRYGNFAAAASSISTPRPAASPGYMNPASKP